MSQEKINANVYMILADGFEESEAVVPADILRRAGATVRLVSLTDNMFVIGSHDITIRADMRIEDVDPDDISCLVLPGGGEGTKRLQESLMVHSLIQRCAENGAYIGAICAAPSILGEMGLLSGRRAVCYPTFAKYLDSAVVTRSKVEFDDIYITAVGAGAAFEFGFKLAEVICGEDVVSTLKTSMRF